MPRGPIIRCVWLVLALAFGVDAPADTRCSADGGAFDPGTGGTGFQAGIGTGGTGIDAAPGQGGTGQQGRVPAAHPGSGGTGQLADPGTGGTGIVGVITGFASVCVNGIEAEFDARTVILDNGKPASPASLKVGQIVHVQAAGRGERVFAKRIDVADVMVGPVTRVDVANRRVEVMHQPVRWREAPGASPISELRPGQFVRVSGFRATDGEVLASRIDRAPSGPVRLTGAVGAARGREMDVQGVRVEAAALAAAPPRETVVRVEGEWQGDGIGAARIVPASIEFGRDVAAVSVQGVVAGQGAELHVGGLRVPLGAAASIEGAEGARLRDDEVVQVEASVRDDGKFDVRKVVRGEHLGRGGRGGELDDSAREETSGARTDEGEDSDQSDGRDEATRRDESDRAADDGGRHGGRATDEARTRSERDGNERDTAGGRHGGDRREDSRSERREQRIREHADSGRDRDARAERVERVERVDRVERVERVDRLERVERADRTDNSGRHGRDH